MSRAEMIGGFGPVPVMSWTRGVPFEAEARAQVENVAKMPFVGPHIAIMPDVHAGIGATVGSVIPTTGAIIPASVGVDIGCGMVAQCTTLKAKDLPDNLGSLRSAIEKAVPHGRTDNGGANDRGAWGSVPYEIASAWGTMQAEFEAMCEKHPKLTKANTMRHLGTLGTGNHFIELCLDESQRVWVMLHSGSRGVGGRIGSYFIELAKEEMRRWFVNLPDIDLAYLPQGSQYFDDYIKGVRWAQKFALTNRQAMMRLVLQAMGGSGQVPFFRELDVATNCHHNYVSWERHFGKEVILTRKGAVSARAGELGIIPGSMGAKSYIVRGKGNRDSFMSCSHGAGRVMSRTKAKATFSLEDHARATEGVECRKDESVLDETPGAYKSIDAVMAAQSDLVEIVHTLKQVLCVKG